MIFKTTFKFVVSLYKAVVVILPVTDCKTLAFFNIVESCFIFRMESCKRTRNYVTSNLLGSFFVSLG